MAEVFSSALPAPSLASEIWTLGRFALVAAVGLAAATWGWALWPGRRPPPAPLPIPAYAPVPKHLLLRARGEPDAL